jgi:hypothetical protein
VIASVDTPQGTVSSAWTYSNNAGFTLSVSVPTNTVAKIHIPRLNVSNIVVLEHNNRVWASNSFIPGDPGIIEAVSTSNGDIVFTVGGGSYSFKTSGDPPQIKCSTTQEVRERDFHSFSFHFNFLFFFPLLITNFFFRTIIAHWSVLRVW